jgi:hypothetical protein
MATFLKGGRYLYTLLGLPATLTEVFGNYHQVNLRLDDGREFQGVWFHHLQDLPPVPKAPKAVAPIHDSVGPTSDPPPGPKVETPRQFASRLAEEAQTRKRPLPPPPPPPPPTTLTVLDEDEG